MPKGEIIVFFDAKAFDVLENLNKERIMPIRKKAPSETIVLGETNYSTPLGYLAPQHENVEYARQNIYHLGPVRWWALPLVWLCRLCGIYGIMDEDCDVLVSYVKIKDSQ